MIDDYDFLKKKEFKDLTDKEKWQYTKSLTKLVKSLDVQAEKNCEECEKQLITSKDVNIDLLFEDWRYCKEHCDECGKEEQIYMCDLQKNLMNHIANEVNVLRKRLNGLTRIILRKDKSGSKLLKQLDKKIEKEERQKKSSEGMFA